MVYFSRMRVWRVVALMPCIFALVPLDAGCGNEAVTNLFDDAGPDSLTATVTAHDAGPLLFDLSDNGAVDFGPAECAGTAPPARKLTLKNTGPVPIVYRAELEDLAAFVIKDGASGSVAAGARATVTLLAQPISSAAKVGEAIHTTLTLSDALGHQPLHLPVTITPTGGVLSVTTRAAIFGNVPISTKASDLPLVIKNTGTEAISVIVTAPTDADFSVTWTGAPTPTSIAPGESLAGAVAHFAPSKIGPHAGEATVIATGALCGARTQLISLTSSDLDAGTEHDSSTHDAGSDAHDASGG